MFNNKPFLKHKKTGCNSPCLVPIESINVAIPFGMHYM